MVRLSLVLKAGHTVEIIRRLAPSFEAETGVGLDIEVVSEDEAYNRLTSGNRLPDICTVPYWYLADMVASGSLIGLQSNDFPGDSHPTALSALTLDGTLWAIPHTLTGGALFTRADLLSPTIGPDVGSFEEFLSHWDTIIDLGSSVAIRAGSAFSSAETYRGLLYAAGVDAFSSNHRANNRQLLDPLGALVDRLRRQKQSLTSRDYVQMGELFATGQATMMFDTSAWATIYALDSSFSSNVGYGRVGRDRPAQFFYAEGLGITSDCRDVEAAHSVIRWRHSPSVIREEVTSLNRIDFPRRDLVREPWFGEVLAKGDNQAVFDTVMASWDAIPANYPITSEGFVPWGRSLMAALSEAVDGADVAEALDAHLKRVSRDPQ